jgi:hypothetical protein
VRKLVIEGAGGQPVSRTDARAIARALIAHGVLDSVQTRVPQLKRHGVAGVFIMAGVFKITEDSESETYRKLCIHCDTRLRSVEEHASECQQPLDYKVSLAERMMALGRPSSRVAAESGKREDLLPGMRVRGDRLAYAERRS